MKCLALFVLAACCPPDAVKPVTPPVAPEPPKPQPTPDPPKPQGPVPPVAAQRAHDVVSANGTRNDPYYWLRDDTRSNKEVLGYLTAENDYTKAMLAPTRMLEDTLFTEFKSRIQETDSSVPVLDDGYYYYTRFEAGNQYPIYARKKGSLTAAEQVMLDANELAKGHSFYQVGDHAISRNGRYLAYVEDTVGRRQYTLRIKDLETGKLLPDTVENVAANIEWANDNKTLFYVGKDAETLREDRVSRLVLGGKPEQFFLEPDGQYYVRLGHTKSRRYLWIMLEATTNTEYRLIDADKPMAPARVFFKRSPEHLYSIDHLDGRFVITTNNNAKNFRVMTVADGKETAQANWKELVAHRDDVLIEGTAVAHDFVALSIVSGGLSKVQVLPTKGPAFVIDAPEPTYAMSVIDTPDPKTKRIRYSYNSMVRPSSVYELDLATGKRELLKQVPVPGYDPDLYASDFVHAAAADGAQIPISIVYKKTTKLDGTAPLLIYGYGAYGLSSPPSYALTSTSLLDRGWVYAIAHVRGGEELGRSWYEHGRLLEKKNTFTDFIAATEHLVTKRYADRKRVFAEGGSAGGLLMGAILNLRPDLYRGVAALVPFVDVVTTMLDTSIPLTTNEFDEWGNPADKKFYDYMLSYSPYDNIKPVGYPSIYVRSGLWDSQVQYYEPTKWVARLRATVKPGNPILLDTDMTAGHGGASGRFDRLHQTARIFAFFVSTNDTPDKR